MKRLLAANQQVCVLYAFVRIKARDILSNVCCQKKTTLLTHFKEFAQQNV